MQDADGNATQVADLNLCGDPEGGPPYVVVVSRNALSAAQAASLRYSSSKGESPTGNMLFIVYEALPPSLVGLVAEDKGGELADAFACIVKSSDPESVESMQAFAASDEVASWLWREEYAPSLTVAEALPYSQCYSEN